MKILLLGLLTLLVVFYSCSSDSNRIAGNPNLILWYDKPASIWEEALPLGNGKTGAMVFGGTETERFQLNDITLWSGMPGDTNSPDGPAVLKKTRDAVFRGDYLKAAEEWKKIHGPYCARYLPMGDLFLEMKYSDTLRSEYYRSLDLSNAISTVKFRAGNKKFERESFISFPEKVFITSITCNKNGSVSFDAFLTSKLKYSIESINENTIVLKGKAPYHVAHRDNDPLGQVLYSNEDGKGMSFTVRLRIINTGGIIKCEGEKISVRDADKVTILLTSATSFSEFDRSVAVASQDPVTIAENIIDLASKKTYNALKNNHIKNYSALFSKVSLNLGSDEEAEKLPTDERMLRFNSGKNDPGLQSLYFQYGRYLMISGSRDQKTPMNLQGIWNDNVQPAWGSNYTTNINLEMNYWPSEITNLTECHYPLLRFVRSMSSNGALTARTCFGLDGWCAFHNSDIWAKTSPPGGGEWDSRASVRWSCWPMAGAWLCQDLFRHYEYTGDEEYLKEAWPVMKGAAEFLLGWLVEGQSGYLVTNPSTSPENVFKIDGKTYEISMATTMDIAITRDLFNNCIKTIDKLGNEVPFRERLVKALDKLYPYNIGQYSQLQEWYNDVDDPKDNHRHISHLFGLYPGTEISPSTTPELASAAAQTLTHRGDISTGWSMAWKINWWSRLGDGDHALKILKAGLTYIGPKNPDYKGGGTYPNLFDGHPPFQIDGNFGGCAGIAEMLIQSHDGAISLLPALPSEWKNGEVNGLKTKGNFTVDMKWEKGMISEAVIYSEIGGNCRLRTSVPVRVVEAQAAQPNGPNPNPFFKTSPVPPFINNSKEPLKFLPEKKKIYEIDFMTEKGKKYNIVKSL